MEKSNQSLFEDAIGLEDSSWQEYNLQKASEILSTFQENDWKWLLQSAIGKPIYWQERCAEASGDCESGNSVEVLISLLNSKSILVSAISASELDNMGVILNKKQRGRLNEILNALVLQNSPRQQDVLRLLAAIDET